VCPRSRDPAGECAAKRGTACATIEHDLKRGPAGVGGAEVQESPKKGSEDGWSPGRAREITAAGIAIEPVSAISVPGRPDPRRYTSA
jgi:hypothetical protein